MRVITGSARGKKLGELPGMETRPTTDRVKEGLFNMIQFDIEGQRVLDLFAGTGQLGIECLSRGAAHCTFVDQRRDAVALIRKNLRDTNLEKKAKVLQADSLKTLKSQRESFHLIFLDPPYDTNLLDQALKTIAEIDILSDDGIIICESRAEKELPELPMPYHKTRTTRYGKIKLTLYRKDGSEQ
ncbi:MAG: 16S rRNA (guanine(966)-N(2))-methyltransferase RsmD [Oscillospiraceae bacterium]|nr:16S rRNA (guanine(966)-N(2))-methyltransferase RsmD [Oscillospiraceae bacterium]